MYVLKRYLESVYGACAGKNAYGQLLAILAQLHVLNEQQVKVFLDVDPRQIQPLLIEIFDLPKN